MLAFLKSSGIGTRFISEISDRAVGLYLITLIGAERNFTYWRNTSAAKLLAQDEKVLRAALGKAEVIYFFRHNARHSLASALKDFFVSAAKHEET